MLTSDLAFVLLSFCTLVVSGQHLACDNRQPEGHSPEKRPGDGAFRILVSGSNAAQGSYSPNQVYTVTLTGLKTRYSTQKFTEFLLVAESEKQAMLGQSGLVTTGIFHIVDDSQSRYSDICPDGVTSLNRQPKSEISVLWTAPSILVASCVTFKLTVVERPHVWYMDDGQLTKTLCPNIPQPPTTTPTPTTIRPQNPPPRNFHQFPSQNHVILTSATEPPREALPQGNNKCCACDEAKYDVVFEGIWSKETHPKDFPENEWLLHFSDIIGASHSPNYYFWRNGEVASEGVRQVAEWGSTRHLENELKGQSGQINTIIKARGLWHPNERGKTSAAFRVSKTHHLMSLVSMIGPSPDWIVGISGLELCLPNCTWLEETNLDLLPYDTGSDMGITYMSPNTPATEPRSPIRPLTPTDPNDSRSPFHGLQKIPPFAKVQIRRQRIYPKSCSDNSSSTHQLFVSENSDDDINRPECAVSEFSAWSDCSVTCGKGLRMRKRNYNLPMKADMFRCDRQLVEKEMCLGTLSTCSNEDGTIELDICAVSTWGEWSPCSVTCGPGARTRSRRYKNYMGRKRCNVELEESEECVGPVPICPTPPTAPTQLYTEADCPLAPWSEFSPCSVSCGKGVQIRTRVFIPPDDNPLPRICDRIQLSQRKDCIGQYGEVCSVSKNDAKELCDLIPDQGPCRSHILRYYYNTDKDLCLPFTYGGCKGNRNRFETEEKCNSVCGFLRSVLPTSSLFSSYQHVLLTTSVPTTPSIFSSSEVYTSTTASSPVYRFNWKSTTRPTQEAQEVTTRTISSTKTPIVSASDSEENLNLDLGLKYTEITTEEPPPSPLPLIENNALLIDNPIIEPVETLEPYQNIDCVVSGWREWSSCSVTCGTGTRTRAREVLIEPQNDGRRCPRKLYKKKPCIMLPC